MAAFKLFLRFSELFPPKDNCFFFLCGSYKDLRIRCNVFACFPGIVTGTRHSKIIGKVAEDDDAVGGGATNAGATEVVVLLVVLVLVLVLVVVVACAAACAAA